MSRGARNSSRQLIVDILLRAPLQAPRVVWQHLMLTPDVTRFWANTHHVTLSQPQQILWVRFRRKLKC